MIEIKNLHFKYGKIEALKNINLNIEENKITCLIGPNGAGKTTLLKIISGYLPYNNGHVNFKNKELKDYKSKELARIRAYVPQNLKVDFPFTCMEMVMMGRFPYLKYLGYESSYDRKIVEAAMERTKTLSFKDRLIHQISGGEFQRVVIAQALAQEGSLFILDEPTSHLDFNFQIEIMEIIEELNKNKGLTVILALHDINLASIYSHHLVLINEGKIFSSGEPKDVITEKNIQDVYKRKVTIQNLKEEKLPQIMLSKKRNL